MYSEVVFSIIRSYRTKMAFRTDVSHMYDVVESLLKMQESAKYSKSRSCLSILSYEDHKCFEWENIMLEMFLHQPSCHIHRRKQSWWLTPLPVLSKGTRPYLWNLMKRWSYVLSQVQRVIAVAIAQENIHQKVKLFII